MATFVPKRIALGQNSGMLLIRVLFLLPLIICPQLHAAELQAVLDSAEHYARIQTQGLPGKVTISTGKLDVSRLPDCDATQAYSPPGSRLSGKTYIGVRCLGPSTWTVLVPVQIFVNVSYVSTSRALVAGHIIEATDLVTSKGDLGTLPTGVVIAPEAAIGKSLRNSLAPGQALRSDQLLPPLVIRQGQSVRVISKGSGFAVTSEGSAINNAAEGQVVQIRMSSGQTLSGIANRDGSVEIRN